MNPERAIAYRKQAGGLLEAVLAEEISARAALNCWPTAGNMDLSVRCAYTMLWYFESDTEERHRTESYYADLQLKTLLEASDYLRRGQALPDDLIKDYLPLLAPSEYQASWTWQGPLADMQKRMEGICRILETNPWIQRLQTRWTGTKPKRPL